jgi:hypothetical protein
MVKKRSNSKLIKSSGAILFVVTPIVFPISKVGSKIRAIS